MTRSRAALVIAGVAVLVVILALVRPGSLGPAADGPEDVARSVMTATDNGDCDTLVELTTGDLGDGYRELCASNEGVDALEGETALADLDYVGYESRGGGRVLYFVDGTGEGFLALTLVEDDGWKVEHLRVRSDGHPPAGLRT